MSRIFYNILNFLNRNKIEAKASFCFRLLFLFFSVEIKDDLIIV